MTIYINEEDAKLFEQNGFDQQSVGDTINHYRSEGLSDDDIQSKINQRLEGWRTPAVPKQKVKTEYTYANEDLSGIENDVNAQKQFRKNVDELYDIPQTPIPYKAYNDNNGWSLENVKNNVQAILQGGKNLVKNIGDNINNLGDQTQNINTARGFVAPEYQADNTPLLTGGVSKKSFLNDQKYWLKTKANKFGDALLRIASNMGNSNPYGNLQPVQNPVKTTTNEKGQQIIDYSQESPMEQKIAGSRADYETLKKIRSNPEEFAPVPKHTKEEYQALKDAYAQGKMTYEDAKMVWDNFNAENLQHQAKVEDAARVLKEDYQRKIRNFEVGEKMLDAGLWGTVALNILTGGGASIPTVGGRVVTNTLKNNVKKEMAAMLLKEGYTKEATEAFIKEAAKAGIVDKGVQQGIENYSKNLLLGELGGKMATNAALGGATGMIDMGLLGTAEGRLANYLDIADTNIAEDAANSMGSGAVGGMAFGAAAPILSRLGQLIGKIPLSKTYKPLPNSVVEYTGPKENFDKNYVYSPFTGFEMGESSPLQYQNRMPQDVQYNSAERIAQIAPNTVAKMQQENQIVENTFGAEHQPKRYKRINGKTVRVDENGNPITPEGEKIANVAPNIAASLRAKNGEKLQANETVEQKGNTEDKEWHEEQANNFGKDINVPRKNENALEQYEDKIPKNYKRDEKTKALWLYKNNYITRNEFEKVQNGDSLSDIVAGKEPQSSDIVNTDNDYHLETSSDQVKSKESTSKKPSKKKESKKLDDAGEYDNGEPKHIVINDKFLLDKKNLEIYFDDKNLLAPLSIRKNGEQIGIVMPINKVDTSSLVDIKPIKITAKNETASNTTERKISENKEIDISEQRKNKILEYAKNIKESPDYNAEYAKETIEALAENSRFSKHHNNVELQDLIKDDWKNGDALAYIGQIYGNENGSREAQKQKGLEIIRKDVFNITNKNEQKTAEIDFSKYTTEELERAQQTYKANLGTAAEYGEEQYDAEKKMLDNINNELNKRKQKADKTVSKKSTNSEKYEDYGEKIWGAKKDLWVDYNKALKKDIDTDDISKIKLNDVFPEPNYEKLIQEGVKPELLAIVKACRDIVPTKPKGRKVYYYGKRWIDQLNTFRTFAADILDGNITPEQIDASLEKVKGNSLKEVIDTYKKVGYPAFLNIKGFRISKDLTTWENGKELSPAEWRYWVMDEKNKFGGAAGVFKTEKEAVEFLQRVAEHTKEPSSKSKDVKLVIYKYRGDKAKDGWVIGKKAGSNYIDLKKGFETSKEARNYLDENKDDLVKILEKLKEEPIVRTDVNEARIGGDYRNGEDATPEKFAETFGFRGVQFGNYVESAKRIDDINNAYDAFMDMIGIINIPEKAVSLNGTLGMAFGARGNGGKNPPAAHYEPAEVVINLTKMHGRGSLAHEWWHALDNYFGKMNNDVHGYATEHYTKRGEIRQEVLDAFADIRKTVRNALEERSLSIDSYRSKDYWSQVREMTARSFETYIKYKADKLGISNDYLANIINEELYNSEVKAYPYPKKAEMPEIEKAFDNFFKTIKTRKTDKGIELYNDKGLGKTASEDIDVDSLIQEAINDGVKVNDVKNEQIFEGMEDVADEFGDYTIGKAPSEIFADTTYGLHKGEKDLILINNDAINKIEDEKVRAAVFKHTIRHEFEHARQYKEYTRILDKYSLSDNEVLQVRNLFVNKYKDLNQSAKNAILGLQNKAVNKMLSDIGLSSKEIEHVRDFIECAYVNERRQNYLDKHRDYIEKFNKKTQNLSDKEYENLAKQDKIIAKFREIDYDYRNCKFEANANKEADNLIGGNVYDETLGFSGRNKEIPLHAQQSNAGTQHKHSVHIRNTKQKGQKYQGQEINPLRPVNNETGEGIRQAVRDKVYQWHGDIESDRYDVDKSLNSFIQLTKHRAKEFSKKLGFNVTDTQVREIMPFLRERTELPKNLNRSDLTKLYNALSDTEKEELTKLADSVSNKFEKYYKNYQDVKGEQTAESIENHISHIWDLDKKKKSLLTNYITTSSRFAKRRTIGTLAEGIDGIQIGDEVVKFKPKTLDYAEILKASSDNLIKSTHDSILANEIKNLKYKGKPLVLAASKAPDEWIEVNHPALNKAVYLGEVGEKELPLLMKTAVKVHPEIADYVSSIFEVQKNSDFWNMYDSLNGMIKQLLLGFSGFHGYALSESSVGNAGVTKTLKELNPKKFVDAIKNGNYDVYNNEEAAKKAIRAGVQLGTPSDLQRNLVEDFFKKIPFIGRFVSKAVGANNKILWDVLHNNFKILAFNTAIENLGGNVTKEQERAVAQWVNDSFGGQSWELLGIKKSAIKAASRILLSPDWNFSTIRQAAAAINSEWADGLINRTPMGRKIGKLLGVGEETGSNGARGKIGRGFWLRSALYFTVFYNLLNAAFREKDRQEHPERYPDEMTPYDYSIWSNSYPMDNIYDRIMPKVFIGRNSDGTARMLRVGKQFREVPELATEPITKLSGKTSPLIGASSQTILGMSPSDAIKKWNNDDDVYLNQDIWEGYGADAEKKEGADLALGRLKTFGKSTLVPYIGSKYIGGKHEFSAWDFFAQTNASGSKSKVYKQVKEALKAGTPDKIEEIEMRAYQDGLSVNDIREMVGYAEKDYKAKNTKKYKGKIVDSFKNNDEKEYDRIIKKMQKKHLSQEEIQRIRNKAWENYQEELNRKNH